MQKLSLVDNRKLEATLARARLQQSALHSSAHLAPGTLPKSDLVRNLKNKNKQLQRVRTEFVFCARFGVSDHPCCSLRSKRHGSCAYMHWQPFAVSALSMLPHPIIRIAQRSWSVKLAHR